jgi:hypothetical protein
MEALARARRVAVGVAPGTVREAVRGAILKASPSTIVGAISTSACAAICVPALLVTRSLVRRSAYVVTLAATFPAILRPTCVASCASTLSATRGATRGGIAKVTPG